MASLDARMLIVQFSFSNGDAVPPSLVQKERELENPTIRKGRPSTGVEFFPPCGNVSGALFINDLDKIGYNLVDAFYQPRVDNKDPFGRRLYHMVRYVFVDQAHLGDIHEKFLSDRPAILADLRQMLEQASWCVRAYSNPFFQNGKAVPGERTISVNLNVRIPLQEPDGQPKVVWIKDDKGDRIGDAPEPMRPEWILRIGENALELVPTA